MLPRQKGHRLNKKDILDILKDLDKNLEGIQRKIKLYGLGGTVFVLSDLRHSSKDIDFLVSRKDFRTLSCYVAEIEWKRNIRFDLSPEGLLPDYQYTGYKNHAIKRNYNFNNIDIYYLDNIDLVLTKALAGREDDIKDIKLLTPDPKLIPKKELIKRYQKIKPAPDKGEELKDKFERFIFEFYK